MVFSIMKFSIWHIFIPIVAILSIEIPVVTMIRFLWTGIFSLLPVALPMAIFYFFHKKKSWSDYIFIKNDKVNKLHQIIMIIFVLFLGSWIPLIDAYFITTYNTTYNTGGWLTSSVLLFLVMSTLVNFFKTEWNRRLLVFFWIRSIRLLDLYSTDITPRMARHMDIWVFCVVW